MKKNLKNPSSDVVALRASVPLSWLCACEQAHAQATTSSQLLRNVRHRQRKNSKNRMQSQACLSYAEVHPVFHVAKFIVPLRSTKKTAAHY
jgi:hypothetical protein